LDHSVSPPAPVDADKAQAHFEHGVLHLTLPKSESAKPKQIRISGQALEQRTEQRQEQQGQQGETH
jgi:Hsp20/alpha crystallin family protein